MNDEIENKGTILVIDDEPDMLSLIKRILKPEGYDVLSAADSVCGLSLLKQVKPNLILLDIMMPGPNGFDILERIRQSFDIPVIMVTATRDQGALEKAFNSGADDYIRKPFRPAELVARIATKLRRA